MKTKKQQSAAQLSFFKDAKKIANNAHKIAANIKRGDYRTRLSKGFKIAWEWFEDEQRQKATKKVALAAKSSGSGGKRFVKEVPKQQVKTNKKVKKQK